MNTNIDMSIGRVNRCFYLTLDKRTYKVAAMTYGERLALARIRAGLTQQELADAVGMKQPSLAHLEKHGKGSAYTVKLARACRVSVDWLDDETGEMVAFEVAEQIASYTVALSPDDQQILDTAQYLPPDKLNALMATVRKHAAEKSALLSALLRQQHADETREPEPEPPKPVETPKSTRKRKPYKLPEPGIAKPHSGHHKKRVA